jgi:hypothetical protein
MLDITGFNKDGFPEEGHVLFNSNEDAYLVQSHTSMLKILSSEKYSFEIY